MTQYLLTKSDFALVLVLRLKRHFSVLPSNLVLLPIALEPDDVFDASRQDEYRHVFDLAQQIEQIGKQHSPHWEQYKVTLEFVDSCCRALGPSELRD